MQYISGYIYLLHNRKVYLGSKPLKYLGFQKGVCVGVGVGWGGGESRDMLRTKVMHVQIHAKILLLMESFFSGSGPG